MYLNSRHFMHSFANSFYDLALKIGKQNLPGGARILDPRIMCHEERSSESSFAKEASLDFIPTIEVS